MSKEVFVYRIDSTDTVVSVSDNWHSFASDNGWDSTSPPEEVVGHKLWDFIQGMETRHLYAELFRRARSGRHCRPVPFRCDSPEERRFLELVVAPLANGHLEITSRIVRTQRRDSVGLLDRQTDRSKELVTLCSMCKKMRTPQRQWVEIEDGLAKLKLFEADEMPQLTHGVCPDCYHMAVADLKDSSLPNNSTESDAE